MEGESIQAGGSGGVNGGSCVDGGGCVGGGIMSNMSWNNGTQLSRISGRLSPRAASDSLITSRQSWYPNLSLLNCSCTDSSWEAAAPHSLLGIKEAPAKRGADVLGGGLLELVEWKAQLPSFMQCERHFTWAHCYAWLGWRQAQTQGTSERSQVLEGLLRVLVDAGGFHSVSQQHQLLERVSKVIQGSAHSKVVRRLREIQRSRGDWVDSSWGENTGDIVALYKCVPGART